ncbi:MAG: hypothetical protein AAFZ99_06105 [Pseudomonadota bacterium]
MLIDWIEFGQVSAERDENLSHYFFENGVLEKVINDRHQFLILGRKGAGKTAVFKHFEDNSARYVGVRDMVVSLSLQNYSWDVHNLLSSDGKATSLAFIQSWRFVIYLMAFKALIDSGVKSKKVKQVENLLTRIYTSPAPTLTEAIGQKLFQLSKIKLPSGGLELEGHDLDSLSIQGGEIAFSDVEKDPSLRNSLNNSIERLTGILEDVLLSETSSMRRVFVSFDRIDEAWDTSSFESSQRIISGLIGASEAISSRFKGALRPIVFLREDIFETLDVNDKNKLRADCGQLLAWSKDGLARMLLERVNFFCNTERKGWF